MLGALSLPSVSTGFTSDNKSMVPVSIQGMANKVQNMSPLESMQEVFFDIRDGIDNLGKVFSDKISGLNKHLAFRLETLNNTMSNIGNIASRDLDLEETQTNIDIENEKDEDRDESLEGPKGGGLFTDEFKGKFTGALNRIKDMSFTESLIALGAGLFLIMGNFEKISKFIGETVRFFDENILPRVKSFASSAGEYFTNLFDGLFGKTGVFTTVFEGLANISEAAERGDTKEAILAVGDMIMKSATSIVSLAGTTILGLLKVAIKTINPDADTSKLDEIITFFDELPGKVIAKLEADQKEFDKVLEEDGKLAAAVVLLRQTYNNYIANTLNATSKAFATILKPFLSEDLYDTMMKADFKTESMKSALRVSMKNLKDQLNKIENSISIFINDKIESLNSFLPKALQIDYRMPVKAIEGQNVYVDDDGMTVPMYKKAEIGKDIPVLGDKPDRPIEEIVKDQVLGKGYTEINGKRFYFEEQPLSNKELEELMNNKDNDMSKKTKEINTLKNENVDDKKSSIVAPIFDNKSITVDKSSSQTVTVTDQRVDSIESSSNALLSYFRQ
tara:strand:+ start:20 stop:1702 length:1683 start_codon:yes stop_codon:yes gene_type:complete